MVFTRPLFQLEAGKAARRGALGWQVDAEGVDWSTFPRLFQNSTPLTHRPFTCAYGSESALARSAGPNTLAWVGAAPLMMRTPARPPVPITVKGSRRRPRPLSPWHQSWHLHRRLPSTRHGPPACRSVLTLSQVSARHRWCLPCRTSARRHRLLPLRLWKVRQLG